MSLGSLDQITGPMYPILCLPYIVVFILGTVKSSEFLRLYSVLFGLKKSAIYFGLRLFLT